MKNPGRIYLIDDDELILAMLARTLKREGYEVRTNAGDAKLVESIVEWSPDVVLLDVNLPGQNGMETLQVLKSEAVAIEVIMLTADDSAETAVKAMKIGAWDYLTKPFNVDEVKIVIRNAMENIKLKKEVEYLRKISSSLFENDFWGFSKAKKELKAKVERIAEAHVSSILITGESGVGKEVIARNIHGMMHGQAISSASPFIPVNCSALPDTLLESELFGYEKGAFTDAKKSKKGLFEEADGGTLLLDELGEMKLSLQSKLLRALEERVVRRIGGREERPFDVTVIATTNRDLSGAVEKGEFRMDLFYRLNAFALNVPPLRDLDRREDILVLANNFLASFAKEYKKGVEGFSAEAEKLMLAYRWPGNVRELKNVVRGMVVFNNTRLIMPEHLPMEIRGWAIPVASVREEKFLLPAAGISLDDVEKDLIVQALEMTAHNKAKAARLLNISYDSFRYQLKKFGLDWGSEREAHSRDIPRES
ncbi:MAG: sigma-54 dependent transcriptional regulator [Syntrophales bacterium]|jgi:DNA-binding NtrC family response regulator|nr:sigma-54 dependent transcriptional regulator [Syntrophales bacterium]